MVVFFFHHHIKQIDSMLPCVCSIKEHRRRQNVVRTSVTDSAIASCATFLFLPHYDAICDLLLKRRTATWNLFVKQKRGEMFSTCFTKQRDKKGKQIFYFDHQNVNSLNSRAIITSTACASYRNTIFNQSAHVFYQGGFYKGDFKHSQPFGN